MANLFQKIEYPLYILNKYLVRISNFNGVFININLFDQNYLTRYRLSQLLGKNGPDGQNKFGHRDLLVNATTCPKNYNNS